MKNKKSLRNSLRISFISLFAATICVGCFIKIPLGPVPIVLQNVLCILCAVLLGGFWGSIPTVLFLFAGLVGIPVYSGGTAGVAVWAGPTGGFLGGYFLGAFVASLIAGKPSIKEKKISKKTTLRVSLAIFVGMILLYVPGVIHFVIWATKAGRVPPEKTAFSYTMASCVLPFLPGDAIKIVVAIPVALKVRPILAQYLYAENSNNNTQDNNGIQGIDFDDNNSESKQDI